MCIVTKMTLFHPSQPPTIATLPHPALQVDDLRGSPLSVGSLEEIIDEK
jgi:hypothetical protein